MGVTLHSLGGGLLFGTGKNFSEWGTLGRSLVPYCCWQVRRERCAPDEFYFGEQLSGSSESCLSWIILWV